MSAKALLDSNPNPEEHEIRKALSGVSLPLHWLPQDCPSRQECSCRQAALNQVGPADPFHTRKVSCLKRVMRKEKLRS